MISKAQIKKIHALKNVLGMDDETYRDMLWSRYKVETSKRLSKSQACELIDWLERNAIETGVWEKRRQRFSHLKNREDMASPKQLRMIESMWRDVSYKRTDEERSRALRKFLFRIVGVSDLRFLERRDVQKVVKALQAMKGG